MDLKQKLRNWIARMCGDIILRDKIDLGGLVTHESFQIIHNLPTPISYRNYFINIIIACSQLSSDRVLQVASLKMIVLTTHARSKNYTEPNNRKMQFSPHFLSFSNGNVLF